MSRRPSHERLHQPGISTIHLGIYRGKGEDCTSLQHLMKRPSAIFMMLALWMEFTRLRPLSRAYLNAYSATLVLAFLVMTCTSLPPQQAHRPCTGFVRDNLKFRVTSASTSNPCRQVNTTTADFSLECSSAAVFSLRQGCAKRPCHVCKH